MELSFSNVGEFRGKGNRKTRLGPRVRIDDGRRGLRRAQTPDGIALKKLTKYLDNKPGFTSNDKYSYVSYMANAEQLRVMNMQVLAEVLTYMKNVNHDVTPANFSYNTILPYINRLLPKQEVIEGGVKTKEVSRDELEIMRLRMAATFLRYILLVSRLRVSREEELATAQTIDAARAQAAREITDIPY